jgi:two-component system phosphate regulon response regulator PhoB
MMPARILVVEADDAIRELMHLILTEAGYEVWTWADPTGVEARVLELKPDLVELSLWLTGPADGLDLIATLADNPATGTIPLLICSGDLPQMERHAEGWRAQGYGVLAKPFRVPDLLALVQSLLDARPPGQVAA